MRLSLGILASLFSTPTKAVTTNWRVPITAAYDSANNATVINNNAASSTNKSLPQVTLTTGNRTLGWTIGAVAAPGAVFYYIPIGGYSSQTSGIPDARLEESFDSTDFVDGTWTDITRAPVAPSGRTGDRFGAVGQAMEIASGAARKIRFRLVGATAGGTVRCGFFQRQTDSELNAALILVGDSTVAGFDAANLISYWQGIVPGSDPIVFNLGRGGGDTQTFSNEIVPILNTEYLWAPRTILHGSINDVTAYRPYSSDSGAHARLYDKGATLIGSLRSIGKTIIYSASINFSNYPSGTGGAQNGFANIAVGTTPYSLGEINPLHRSLISEGWDSTVDAPIVDRQMGNASRYETTINPDGIHGIDITAYRQVIERMHALPIVPILDREIALSSPQTDSARKQRLLDMYANLYGSTSISAATAKRSSQLAAINAISTSYSEPAITGSAISPTTLTPATGDFWLDAARWGDFSKTVDGKITSWTDRWNGYVFSQSTSTGKPTWVEKALTTSRPGVYTDGYANDGRDVLVAQSAAVIGALDAANQPFSLYFTCWDREFNTRGLLHWTNLTIEQNGNVHRLRAFNFGGSNLNDTATDFASLAIQQYAIVYDGTTARMYRNGALVSTQTWSKAATTGSTMRLFTNPADSLPWGGGVCDIIFQKTAHDATTRAGIVEYLRQKSGTP